MPKGNKYATGRKTNCPLKQLRISAPVEHIEKLGLYESIEIAKKASRQAILTAFQNKIK